MRRFRTRGYSNNPDGGAARGECLWTGLNKSAGLSKSDIASVRNRDDKFYRKHGAKVSQTLRAKRMKITLPKVGKGGDA